VTVDRRRRGLAVAGAATLAGCALPLSDNGPAVPEAPPPERAEPVPGLPPQLQPPASPREFRAAWVASVANIDWPSRPGLSNAQWRAEAIALLDRARALGLNAIVLQVRPAADALYASTIEPWSEYLTGAQGRAPSPPDDPLAMWVAEAHKRGLELHAWFNPYRARHSTAKSPLAGNHIAQLRPDAVKRYGDLLWMDPAEPEAVAQTLAVVADVVWRYDIDGVHIDDYFYPYPVTVDGVDQPFPDDPAWLRYLQGGGTLDRADWRRAQVDRLVEAMHRKIHELKPGVRFGISPFGIGKPALRPAGIAGFSQYDKLYADVERWLAQGWLDYLAPQLYWPLDRAAQSFDVLLDYWLAQNARHRHVWPGLFTSMVGATAAVPVAPPASAAPGAAPGASAATNGNARSWPASEVLAQVDHVRARPAATGHLHFSMAALMQDRDGIATRLRAGPYAQPALVPATPWLGGGRPRAPGLRRGASGAVAIVPASTGAAARLWSVWRLRGGSWRFEVQPADVAASVSGGDDLLVVRGVDALGHEGDAAALRATEQRSA
jgi:uncharacterized lipoprotein YddW (UPF0748 family)